MIKTTLLGSNLPVLQSQLLLKEAGIVHFCTLRGGNATPYSDINMCDYTGDDLEHVVLSRRLYADCLGISPDRIWLPHQVHGTRVLSVDSAMEAGQEADAVITAERRLLVGVSTADCVPVILYDPKKQVIGAVHAGWRGTIGRIAEKAVAKMQDVYGCEPTDILAAIGPSISPEAFEVGDEVSDRFAEDGYADCVVSGFAKPHVNLWAVNVRQLLAAGLRRENVDCSPVCTYGNSDILFSARKLGIRSGRIISAIMLK